MLGTLVRLVKEFVDYDRERLRGRREEGFLKWDPDEEKVKLNWLCTDARKSEDQEVMVAEIDLRDRLVRINDYDFEGRWRYLYWLSSGRKGMGPSWAIDVPADRTALVNKVKGAMKQIEIGLDKYRESGGGDLRQWVENCLGELRRDGDALVSEVSSKIGDYKRALIFVTYGGKALADFKEARDAFVKLRTVGSERAQYAGTGTCTVCRKHGEVRASLPFDHYRVYAAYDKPALASGGIQEAIWKNLPICQECSEWLAMAENALRERLETRIAGKNAFVIPDLEPGTSRLPDSFVGWLWDMREKFSKEKIPRLELMGWLIDEEGYKQRGFKSLSIVFFEHEMGQKMKFTHVTPNILPRNLEVVSQRLKEVRERLEDRELGEPGRRISGEVSGKLNFIDRAWRLPETEGAPILLSPMLIAEHILLQTKPDSRVFWSDVARILRAIYLSAVRDREDVRRAVEDRVAYVWTVWCMLYGVRGEDSTPSGRGVLEQLL